MDRAIVYPGAIPADTDFLGAGKFAYVGHAKLAAAVLGGNALLNGLPCTPAAGLNVQVGAGEMYAPAALDATAFGSLAADGHVVLHQGILLDPVTLACPAPQTSGQSIAYLVEVSVQQQDGSPTILPFYDSANPAQPYTGPANSGAASNTVRTDALLVQVKAGAAATTGSQAPPAPDAGYTAAYVVTVAYGQTAITSGNIAPAPSAPFLTENLLAKISKARADTLYQPLGSYLTGRSATYTASGSWTPPAGVTAVRIEVIGGGGGGGGAGSGKSGGGGGAGGYAAGLVACTPGTPIPFTVGAGGAGGPSATDGSAGGSTTCGAISASGGAQGLYSASSAGGAPGVGAGGDINTAGGYGTDGHPSGTFYAGNGGGSKLGGGGRGGSGGGLPGGAPGSGGGGAYNGSGAGGQGANGAVIFNY